MDDASATLLLTRPQEQSEAFLAQCERDIGRSLPVIISPLLRIEPVGEVPDLDAFDTIILTSGNGVSRLAGLLAGRQVATVGAKTAELAAEFGALSDARGETVDAFLESIDGLTGHLLFCRGVHSRGSMAKRLREKGRTVTEVVLYNQLRQPLNETAQRLLKGDKPVVAPIFSPRTAKLLSANRIEAPITVVVISAATARSWTGPGEVQIATSPNAHKMRQLVQQAF